MITPGQTITLHTNDAYDGATAVVNCVWSSGDVSVTVAGESDSIAVHPSEIEGMETHTCAQCGATVTALDGRAETSQAYSWDGSDEEGSIARPVTRWQCRDIIACHARRIESAIGAMARADAEDASAREGGWGAIRYH